MRVEIALSLSNMTLIDARRKTKLTQGELAHRATISGFRRVSQTDVSNLERLHLYRLGSHDVALEKAQSVASVLDLPFQEVFPKKLAQLGETNISMERDLSPDDLATLVYILRNRIDSFGEQS